MDIQELIEFKQKAEQSQLESQGKYTEARQALEQHFRDASAEKDQRIAELEARVKELELITPAISALADVVHDPDMVLKTKLSPDRIEREQDGTVSRVGTKDDPVIRIKSDSTGNPVLKKQSELSKAGKRSKK